MGFGIEALDAAADLLQEMEIKLGRILLRAEFGAGAASLNQQLHQRGGVLVPPRRDAEKAK